eukprot:PhF_6_TR18696/c0_g1_i2/m.27327/K12462/ARHGDI, RHOGDI; Rho GDP-dissociation inhibitor
MTDPTDGSEDPDLVLAKPSERSNLTLEQLDALAAQDESLKRYKEALLGNVAKVDPLLDPRRFVLLRLSIEMDDHPKGPNAYSFDMSKEEDRRKFETQPIVFKESCVYRFRLLFLVQHDISTNLRMTNKSYKGPLKLNTMKMFIGSYAPTVEEHEWTSEDYEAPSGWLARTTFTGNVEIMDDATTHCTLSYCGEIKS